MASTDDVKKLAALARLSIPDADLARFAEELDGILAYMSQLESLDVKGVGDAKPSVRNVFREDGEPHTAGAHTEKLTEQFPERENDLLKVKQIVNYD